MPSSRARIVVLASGGGTNCQAVIDASARGDLEADIVAVVTNNPDAGVISRAREAGISAHVIDHAGTEPEARRAGDDGLIELLHQLGPDLVVLAGWMRILGARVGQTFPMINLHPALPGQFPGTRAIERAFEAWQSGELTESGVMVHWVPDDGVDVGPVILQEAVPFRHGDDLAEFADRMHGTEHRLIVAATRQALQAVMA